LGILAVGDRRVGQGTFDENEQEVEDGPVPVDFGNVNNILYHCCVVLKLKKGVGV